MASTIGMIIVCTTLAGSARAGEVGWGDVTASYDGKKRSVAQGEFYNKKKVYAENRVRTKDLAPDGNTVYAEMEFHFDGGLTGIGYHTPEHNHTYYVQNYLRSELDGASQSVRGSTHACVQMGYPVPDRCSVWAQPSFSY
ncbi:hypothetical protein [Streptomyces sp. NPDC058045]|uniref:hypothetical protein n=1 Tax=Streptomyces sp. NPDC058045 TaxID=3346311 RepID=UPI0036EE2688